VPRRGRVSEAGQKSEFVPSSVVEGGRGRRDDGYQSQKRDCSAGLPATVRGKRRVKNGRLKGQKEGAQFAEMFEQRPEVGGRAVDSGPGVKTTGVRVWH
jgi:hypothetical protein